MNDSKSPLTRLGRWLILMTAVLGWLFAGVQMSMTSLGMRSASIDLLNRVGQIDGERFHAFNRMVRDASGDEAVLSVDERRAWVEWQTAASRWFAWYQCAFLFGAAAGGLVFGWLGDRIGRSKAMAASILCYSLFSGLSYFVVTPGQLLVLRFVTCMGVGGMWPNGVALLAEAWSKLSRPFVAGAIGTAANIGIFLMATLATREEWQITPQEWRWITLVGASPVVLGLFVLAVVPESPLWLAARDRARGDSRVAAVGTRELFRPPLLRVTLIGILLATIPLFGGWGSANWAIPWAGEAGETANPPNPGLKANVQQARSFTGVVGSFLGGWIASILGRRRAYFAISLGALGCAQWMFWRTVPTDPSFLFWTAGLGFFSGVYFGWLPLFLPELFATRIRSAGAGVSFNFGRILTAITVFATGALMTYFESDFARIGRLTSLIFVLGMIIIWFAPDTSKKRLEDIG